MRWFLFLVTSLVECQQVFKFLKRMIPWEEKLEAEEGRSLWSPIFNYGVNKPGRLDRDSGLARYSLTKALLKEPLNKEVNLIYSGAGASMHVWLGWFAVTLKLDEGHLDKLLLPKKGG